MDISSRWVGAIAVASGLLALSGCMTSFSEYVHNGFKVGPNYQRPAAPVPDDWVDKKDPRVKQGDPNLATWWETFEDPILNDLIARAYANSPTVRAAAFQTLQAREQRAIAFGELFPQTQSGTLQLLRAQASGQQGAAAAAVGTAGAGLAPSATLNPTGGAASSPVAGTTPGSVPGTTTNFGSPGQPASIGGGFAPPGVSAGSGRFFSNNALAFNATWELDFWGLFRRNLEAMDASVDQSIANYDTMVIILLANVAQQYIEIRTLQRRIELAKQNVALQEPLVKRYEQRFKKGMPNSPPGYYQLKSNLDNTKALIPQLEITLRQSNNQLCVLLGETVRDLLPELGDGTVADAAKKGERTVRIPRPSTDDVIVGIPGNLLLRRPDVVAAEMQLKFQSAQIGIAEAELLPHIGVNGSIGVAASSINRVFATQAGTGTIGPSLSWNILNYGRLLANVRFQDFQYKQFVANYQNTLLSANQDAENAMVGYLKSREQTEHLQNSADMAVKLTNYLVNQLNKEYLPPGSADTGAFINQLFTAINFQVTQQDAAAQAEGNIALNLALLYRAMGGGWEIRKTGNPNDPAFPCGDPTTRPHFGAPAAGQ